MSNLGRKGNGRRTGRGFRHPVARCSRALIDSVGVSLAGGFPGFHHRRCLDRAFAKLTAPALWREPELEPFLGFGEYSFLPDPIVWTEVDYADAKAKEAEEEVEAEAAAAAAAVVEVAAEFP